jgi:hypothetical protein
MSSLDRPAVMPFLISLASSVLNSAMFVRVARLDRQTVVTQSAAVSVRIVGPFALVAVKAWDCNGPRRKPFQIAVSLSSREEPNGRREVHYESRIVEAPVREVRVQVAYTRETVCRSLFRGRTACGGVPRIAPTIFGGIALGRMST